MKSALFTVLCIYLVVVNLAAFLLYGSDKRRAKRGRWRISEKNLFLAAILGGSIGALVGMRVFRHKTRHWYFRFGIPLILVLQVLLVWAIYTKVA